jgi:hypothetical protein
MQLFTESGEPFETLDANKLGEFIQTHCHEIVGGFLGLARREIPAVSQVSLDRLKDHLPSILSAMAKYLNSNGSETEFAEVVSLAKAHALIRAANPEYTEKQMSRESMIVREVIFGLIGRRTVLEKEAARQLSDISEAALGASVAAFVRASANA